MNYTILYNRLYGRIDFNQDKLVFEIRICENIGSTQNIRKGFSTQEKRNDQILTIEFIRWKKLTMKKRLQSVWNGMNSDLMSFSYLPLIEMNG